MEDTSPQDDDGNRPDTDVVVWARLKAAIVAGMDRQPAHIRDQLETAVANDDLRFRLDDADAGPLLAVVIDGRDLLSVPLASLLDGT